MANRYDDQDYRSERSERYDRGRERGYGQDYENGGYRGSEGYRGEGSPGGGWRGGEGVYENWAGGYRGEVNRGQEGQRQGGFSSGYGGGLGNYNSGQSGWGNYGGGMGSYTGQQQGRFAGRGPRGYKRSDDRIQEDVNEHLTQHPEIDATEIDVQVSNGEVTLSGTVDDRQAKRLAEDVAEHVSGVKDVHNTIRVQSGASSTATSKQTTGSHKS